MKVLIVKTSSLGDVIHMLPAVTDAARAVPQLRVDWLVEESFASIPAWHPAINRVIPIAMRRWKKQLAKSHTWRQIGAARTAMRETAYDLVIDSQGLLKSALWSWMARGPGVGYHRTSAREPLASFFYERGFIVSQQLHAIERNRHLMALALDYRVCSAAPDYGLQCLSARLHTPGITLPPKTVIGLHATSRADKLWPTMNWQALAHTLGHAGFHLALPWGNDEERLRAEEISAWAPQALVLPKLGLDALASLIDQSVAVVGVDTGLLHLAAALGKPGLALYTSTLPALTGAVSDRHAAAPLVNLSGEQALEAPAVIRALMMALQKG